jgi:hypothetical protein
MSSEKGDAVSSPRSFSWMSKNSRRMGLPVTVALPRKCGAAASKETAAARTKRASTRFVNPGTAFDSMTSVGTRMMDAVSSTGPET